MIWLAMALSFSGFTALCLAMEKHQLDLYGKAGATPRRRRQLRALGWTTTAVACAGCVAAQGWAMGPVLWLGSMTAAGIVLTFWLLPYRPSSVVATAWAAPLLTLLLLLIARAF